jgi:lipopolysaccharide biosynthesis regulator YciM
LEHAWSVVLQSWSLLRDAKVRLRVGAALVRWSLKQDEPRRAKEVLRIMEQDSASPHNQRIVDQARAQLTVAYHTQGKEKEARKQLNKFMHEKPLRATLKKLNATEVSPRSPQAPSSRERKITWAPNPLETKPPSDSESL